jgi:hypothetical protein
MAGLGGTDGWPALGRTCSEATYFPHDVLTVFIADFLTDFLATFFYSPRICLFAQSFSRLFAQLGVGDMAQMVRSAAMFAELQAEPPPPPPTLCSSFPRIMNISSTRHVQV